MWRAAHDRPLGVSAMTTPPPPEDTPDTTYLAFFTPQRPAFVRAVSLDCQTQIELYRQLPFTAVEQNIDQTFGVYMDAFIQGDTDTIVGWIEQRLAERMVQGLSFSEALRIPAIFRRHLVGFSLPAVARQIPGAIEGITFANVACDAMVEQIGDLYRRRLEAATAELRRFQVLAETAIDGIAVANARFEV